MLIFYLYAYDGTLKYKIGDEEKTAFKFKASNVNGFAIAKLDKTTPNDSVRCPMHRIITKINCMITLVSVF